MGVPIKHQHPANLALQVWLVIQCGIFTGVSLLEKFAGFQLFFSFKLDTAEAASTLRREALQRFFIPSRSTTGS